MAYTIIYSIVSAIGGTIFGLLIGFSPYKILHAEFLKSIELYQGALNYHRNQLHEHNKIVTEAGNEIMRLQNEIGVLGNSVTVNKKALALMQSSNNDLMRDRESILDANLKLVIVNEELTDRNKMLTQTVEELLTSISEDYGKKTAVKNWQERLKELQDRYIK